MPPLVLASTSLHRRAILDRLGYPYMVETPAFEEVAPPGLDPLPVAALFAREKARSVASRHPGSLIIGADQTLDLDGAMLRKPHDLAESCQQLLALAGRSHRLHSAIALLGPGPDELREVVVSVTLTMRPLTVAQARRYVSLDQPAGSVGGYLYERWGYLLFDEVAGADDTAIVGLPLFALARLLRAAGMDPLG